MKLIHAPYLFKAILKNYEAITIYPFVFYKNKPLNKLLLNHERIHFDQIQKCGVIKYYLLYIKEYILNRAKGMNHLDAYLNISYEKEAYQNQKNLDYKVK